MDWADRSNSRLRLSPEPEKFFEPEPRRGGRADSREAVGGNHKRRNVASPAVAGALSPPPAGPPMGFEDRRGGRAKGADTDVDIRRGRDQQPEEGRGRREEGGERSRNRRDGSSEALRRRDGSSEALRRRDGSNEARPQRRQDDSNDRRRNNDLDDRRRREDGRRDDDRRPPRRGEEG